MSGTKHATLMLLKVLEAIKCAPFCTLFHQINLIPLNKNGVKKLPISKKIKLDLNLMSDFTVFDAEELPASSSLLRAGSSPMTSRHLSNMLQILNDENKNDSEEMKINALPPRPITDDDIDDD